MGLLILFYCCGANNFFTIVCWLGAYLILRFLPAKPAMYLATIWGSIFALGRTLYEFAHRDNPANVKFILLLISVKIHMLAVQNYDRDRIKKGLDKDMSPRERECADIGELNFFDWANFFLFGPCCFPGPNIEFVKYKKFINLEGEYGRMPRTGALIPAFGRFFLTMFLLGMYLWMGSIFKHTFLFSDEFGELNFLEQSWHVSCTCYKVGFMLMQVFTFMECFVIACGLGYSEEHTDKAGNKQEENYNTIRTIELI